MEIANHDNAREDEMEIMKIPWKNSLIAFFLVMGIILFLMAIKAYYPFDGVG